MSDILATYIRLTPEFGGTEFGPYEGLEICLGSDHNSCDIHIPADFGTFAIHAKLIRQSATDVILSPAEQSAEVFLWRGDSRRSEPVYGPTAVKHGDHFSLVTPQGPKFIVEFREIPIEIQKEREEARKKAGTGRKRLSKESMKTEAKRQVWTQLLVLGPVQLFQRAMVYIKSGAIFQPRNIIMGLTILSGYAFGISSCRSRNKMSATVQTTSSRLESCKRDVQSLEDVVNSDEYDFNRIVLELSRSVQLQRALKEDSGLRALVKKEAQSLFVAEGERWLLEGKGLYADRFKRWAKAVKEMPDEQMDPTTRNLMVWLPSYVPRTSQYDIFSNSEGKESCGLGMIGLTYRQAMHLGLEAQPDSFYAGQLTKIADKPDKISILEQSMLQQGFEEEFTASDDYTEETVSAATKTHCLHREGDDDRRKTKQLLRSLSSQIGPKARDLPDSETSYGTTSRIAKIYAADIPRMNFAEKASSINFMKNHIGIVLEQEEDRGAWALKRTAKVIARSLVLPCLLTLDGDPTVRKDLLGEETPSPLACFALYWRLSKSQQ
jgi:hypothetical protein